MICEATGFVVYLGHATSPEDACIRATRDTRSWGSLGRFQRNLSHPTNDGELTWLDLSVHDVTGLLEPNPDVDPKDAAALAAMTEDNAVDQFSARQY